MTAQSQFLTATHPPQTILSIGQLQKIKNDKLKIVVFSVTP